jgi:hypothetical protein
MVIGEVFHPRSKLAGYSTEIKGSKPTKFISGSKVKINIGGFYT